LIESGIAEQEDEPKTPQVKTDEPPKNLIEISLKNINDQQYTGSLWFGNPPQEMVV